MGASPYWYFTPYEPNLFEALGKLREKEFKAGRFYPATDMPTFPVEETEQHKHNYASIDQAMTEAAERGTCSILDISTVGSENNYCHARRLSEEELEQLFGTGKPRKAQIEGNYALFDLIERGKAICIVVYEGEKASELFFAGYSFD